MIVANHAQTKQLESLTSLPLKFRRELKSEDPVVFAGIYQEQTNIAIWRRSLTEQLKSDVNRFLDSNPTFQTSTVVTKENAFLLISKHLNDDSQLQLAKNISQLVEIFCDLFEIEQAGLRLTSLDRAMCPKFHVDKLPCRLITTFQSVATEWLPHESVDRSKLGLGSNGKPDNESGIFTNPKDIQRLTAGDVALLKGELWEDNENAGLVHRSPVVPEGQRRLVLTLDFVQ